MSQTPVDDSADSLKPLNLADDPANAEELVHEADAQAEFEHFEYMIRDRIAGEEPDPDSTILNWTERDGSVKEREQIHVLVELVPALQAQGWEIFDPAYDMYPDDGYYHDEDDHRPQIADYDPITIERHERRIAQREGLTSSSEKPAATSEPSTNTATVNVSNERTAQWPGTEEGDSDNYQGKNYDSSLDSESDEDDP